METDLIVGGLLFHDNVRQMCKKRGIRVVRLSGEVLLGLILSSTRLGSAFAPWRRVCNNGEGMCLVSAMQMGFHTSGRKSRFAPT
jgi:hypothetical protein